MQFVARFILVLKRYGSLSELKPNEAFEHMTRIILAGSFIVDIVLTCLLSVSFSILGHTYVFERIFVGIFVFVYLLIIGCLVHKNHIRLGAWMLIILYAIIGLTILHLWGINAPVGILILTFVIVLSSVMLGAKRIIPVTIGIIFTLIILQYFNIVGISQPDRSMLDDQSTYGDVASYSVVFCIFALIAWIAGTKMENALERAVHAEVELQEEKDALVMRVEEQTNNLKLAQQKELKQLYKFAELGQLTTIILHELANYLSVLTLDIDDIKDRHQNSIAIEHAKESIFYIDTIIDQVRNQIKNSEDVSRFDAYTTTRETLEQLRKKLNNPHIKLFIEDDRPKDYLIFGDPLRLSQAITILVTNAEQASKSRGSEILIELNSKKSKIVISVKDFGKGIPEDERRTLFQPHKSKKGAGLGIGLYVTKQIIETHFKGRMWLSPAFEYTQFNIEIPRSKK